MAVKRYVKLRFYPAGSDRARTVWAVKMGASAGRMKYFVCDVEGDTEKHIGYDADGVEIVRKELIVADVDDIVFERPAYMNLKYGELELY
jgi:hypothetical protein